MKSIGTALLGLLALGAIVLGANNNEPYLVALRGLGNIVLLVCGVAIPIGLIRAGTWRDGKAAGRLLVALWLVPAPCFIGAQFVFQRHKHHTLNADEAAVQLLGRHFVVGYASAEEAGLLAGKGLIAGLYVTRHNVAGRTIAEVRGEIAALQERRHRAGLAPLIVAADQEGGIVTHLSPPLTALPALSTLANLPPDIRKRKAEELGRTQGEALASIGVDLNLAPVLDLRPAPGRIRFDFNTLIGQRAISNDSAVVADVALAYVRGLDAAGVGATVKHFPGLGRVGADTHHFAATLDASVEELEATDWRPFREVLARSKARLMVGHVALAAIDPDRPASHSKRVIEGLIRGTWGYHGVVISDDLVMGAIYGGNVCTAVVEALNAGADLLLVAYDGAQFFRIFDCALDAYRRGALDPAMLRASEGRLKQAAGQAPAAGM
ncbi:glycoside hydrolase family 3 N-terminal domain-containing protein [Bradyrhizobium sp.]|jgi:beta-N-acetylhexosaminidase|uniref:glycoside hydrolase family 3 N-terminal domain-containing protein n=1 Tax=Bradyrhizobium sp. TaxID=376 RepID=UPI002C5AE043|nr:glycoside hydrolase family 3 N-terminal domain-containing protein [Bradyrhizobium sp.]HWX63108.1 glycoside hydrolase family 3 N-terminal domain-containing protein [Bradyrhizobium sp.]